MQAAMPAAVTHDDLSLRKAQERRAARSSGRAAVALVSLSVLCGIVGFILCLAAEGSRSEASHYLMTVGGGGANAAANNGQVDVCFYNSSGRAPLAFAIGAFLLLAVAMFAEHAYMLLAVAAPDSSAAGLAVAEGHPRVPSDPARLTWQTCCLFFVTWICFGLAEVMLMVGIAVESGHVSDWRKPRAVCHRVRPGVFAAAGILGLITVVVGFVVYVTALQTNKLRAQHPVGGYYVGHGAPHPGMPPPPMPYGPHPHPHPPPLPAATAPSAPEITPAACQVQPSRAACVTKQCADAV
uniref:Uncharacterized protein n=1 Tax=Oryza glumipatula TaxID=40148 RepID=A0A0D9Y660_9ORYZ